MDRDAVADCHLNIAGPVCSLQVDLSYANELQLMLDHGVKCE
jgi:hypothetical protein